MIISIILAKGYIMLNLKFKKILAIILTLLMFTNIISIDSFAGIYNPSIFSGYTQGSSFYNAGLAFGPVKVGDMYVKVTNIHNGPVGSWGNVNHINLHVYKRTTKKTRDVVNLHIVKYRLAGQDCIRVYDAVSKTVVIDQCFLNFEEAAKAIANFAKNIAGSTSNNTNKIVNSAVWGSVAAVITTILLYLAPVAL